jgi:acyl-CoA synthetase (AMP-forming)/AMP-acid ligase II/acyl-coenzyme A thioesterase PaaI-like protein
MTKPVSLDWVSMVGAAQATTAPAVVTVAQQWSGEELLGHAAGAAEWLSGAGLPEGVPVPALLQASPEALALVLAGAAIRRPIAPLGPRLTVRELAGCLERLAAPCLVTQPGFADMAAAAAPGREILVLGELPRRVLGSEPLPVPSPDDTAVVLHTSGTTGHPRAVAYRHDRLARRCRLNATLQQLGPGSVFATASPFHHIAGLGNIMVALAAGATTVAVPRFTVEAWRELEPLGVTHALAVPTMVEMLLRQGALPLRTLRVMQYGASPIHPDTLRAAMGQLPGTDFLTLYGQTEGSPITWLSPEDHRLAAVRREELLQSVGRAAPGVEVRIADQDGSGAGEVMARAAHLFAVGPDGWLRTGDLGRLGDDGYLYLVGRRGDMIIRGGENVYPQEVENRLLEHPRIADAAVIGVPDRLLGETLKAFVVPADPAEPPDPEELRAFARAALAGFKVPAQWDFVSVLPRTATGKLLRRELLRQFTDADYHRAATLVAPRRQGHRPRRPVIEGIPMAATPWAGSDFQLPPEPTSPVALCGACRRLGNCRLGLGREELQPDGSVHTELVCGPENEGGPDVAHGGWTAGVFDEVLGHVPVLNRELAVTGQLSVTYVKPVPVGRPLHARAWTVRRAGHRWYVAGEMTLASTGAVLARGEAVMVLRDAGHFTRHQEWLAQQDVTAQPQPG